MASWTSREFVEVPESVVKGKASVKIEENWTQVSVGSEVLKVFYREAKPPSETIPAHQVPLLLLHGKAFKSQTWHDLGTLHLAAAAGARVVAVDLPGYGNTSDSLHGPPADFLLQFTKEVNLDRPIIVSPSMSGSYSLPYLITDPTQASSRARGYIPVAPVTTGNYTAAAYAQVTIPSLIVFGSNDKQLGSVSTGDLKNLANSRLCCFEGAGHACYLNNPDLWHKVLYNFLDIVEGAQ